MSAQGLPGPLPLQLSLATSGGMESRVVRIGPEGGAFTIDTPEPPRRVAINEDRGLLARVARSAQR